MSVQSTSLLDMMRIRYMKGEPLMQPGDSFDFAEALEAMQVVVEEARLKNLTAPIPMGSP